MIFSLNKTKYAVELCTRDYIKAKLSVPPCGNFWAVFTKHWLSRQSSLDSVYSVQDRYHLVHTKLVLLLRFCKPFRRNIANLCLEQKQLFLQLVPGMFIQWWMLLVPLKLLPKDLTAREERIGRLTYDVIIHELARYNASVGALQETKWFGNEVYRVADGVVLTARRCTPTEGDVVQRGEGVALVLRDSAIFAWNRGGNGGWHAWKSWCVSVHLELYGTTSGLHVISCYTPTRAAP